MCAAFGFSKRARSPCPALSNLSPSHPARVARPPYPRARPVPHAPPRASLRSAATPGTLYAPSCFPPPTPYSTYSTNLSPPPSSALSPAESPAHADTPLSSRSSPASRASPHRANPAPAASPRPTSLVMLHYPSSARRSLTQPVLNSLAANPAHSAILPLSSPTLAIPARRDRPMHPLLL